MGRASAGDGDALPPSARARLERFAVAFDRLDAREFVQFAGEETDPATLHRALEVARAAAGHGRRRAAIEAAIGSARDAAARAYSRRMNLADTFLLYQTVPDTADDRARFLASLERVIAALVLWDELDEETIVTLVGPWAALAEGAAEGA